MENKNQSSREQQGSSLEHQSSTNADMPTSAGGNKEYESPNQEDLHNETQMPPSEIQDDAESRVINEEETHMQPQIDEEGEFKHQSGWTRTAGLSEAERNTAEEEELNGRRSADDSVL